jgi:hypothetical protein
MKSVYIWGAGQYGVLSALDCERKGVKVVGFIDSNASQIKTRLALPVLSFEYVLSLKEFKEQIIIAIKDENAIKEISEKLKNYGLDFTIYKNLPVDVKNCIDIPGTNRRIDIIIKRLLNVTSRPYPYLDSFGYQVYSQNDEDGIINEIFKRIGTTNKKFVEFGVQDGLESNCHFLLLQGWCGLWIDGDEKTFKGLEKYFLEPISTGQLTAINAFITIENINDLIKSWIVSEEGVMAEIDLLSIDIDGNDYWVWQAIKCIEPRVVVIEYNRKFPPPCEYIMEYNPNHIWDGSDEYGASLKSLELLGDKLGYTLVGTNGVNAFFVKKDLAKNLFPDPPIVENLNLRFIYGFHPAKKYIGNKYSTKIDN